jgi:TetR/AcrR family transcriptional repressor of bet genes
MPRVNVKDKRKQQLMEANIVSIAKRGLADTTIAHVSKGAGMSRGIVNFYFTSKDKMMQETLLFLADEFAATWQQTLESERAQGHDPLAIAEAILRALMSDRLCSHKRLAVWAAFFGHAGTHPALARIIAQMDGALTAQLKKLWQEAGFDAKAAETHARQLQALIRGHWLTGALSEDEKRPSYYIDAWVALLRGEPPPAAAKEPKEKVVKLKTAEKAKTKKPQADKLPGQLDFGDLFSR